MQPLILIVSRETPFRDETQYSQRAVYPRAVAAAGCLPLLTAGGEPEELAEAADGLLLPGGDDLEPSLYGEQNRFCCGCDFETDRFELALFHAFYRRRKPILGICRGIQLINVALGGTLYQDLEREYPESGAHRNAVHTVKTQRGSFLHRALGKEFQTNSFHHQALMTCGEGLAVTARTADGVIEGVEHCSRPVLGVQWHPERDLAAMLPLFRWFVAP